MNTEYKVYKIDHERGAALLIEFDEHHSSFKTEEEAIAWVESNLNVMSFDYVVLKTYRKLGMYTQKMFKPA